MPTKNRNRISGDELVSEYARLAPPSCSHQLGLSTDTEIIARYQREIALRIRPYGHRPIRIELAGKDRHRPFNDHPV
jgi:hypothetical protein